MSVTGAGGRASAEGSGSEQNSTWYYAYVYSDGQGTINGLISDKPSWSLIAPGDKPSGSFFTRRVSPLFNDASGNIREYRQINDVIYLNNSSTTSIASLLQIFSGNFVVNLDLSTFIPIIAYQAKITTTGASFDPSTVFFGSPTSAGGTFAQSILNQNSVSDILVSDPSSIQIYMGDITEIYLISYRIDL